MFFTTRRLWTARWQLRYVRQPAAVLSISAWVNLKPVPQEVNCEACLRFAAPVAGLVIILAAGNQYLDYRLQAQRLDGIKKQISFLFKKDYPEATTMVDPSSSSKRIRRQQKTFGFYEAGPEVTALDLLKDISGFIGLPWIYLSAASAMKMMLF